MKLIPKPKYVGTREGACPASVEPDFRTFEHIPSQCYQIEILEDRIVVDAGDDVGFYYAEQTLEQICEQAGEAGLPLCLVKDQPDFPVRGYMLDISRDRVPTMEHLFHLVDCLARLRYNQLQLYTEHTFAYKDHATVWKEASPLTAAEIVALDNYCRERFIELVPNQNSFGHMERWLKHPEYHHLAECPEGFEHPLSGWKEFGSTLKPNEESLQFMDTLYTELLPNFSSKKFNIGGDEPWELGQGWSKEQVEAEGKHAVYARHLKRICELAAQHGAAPMCWADILLEHPEFIKELPENAIPILWGYEADHPFAEQTAILGETRRPYYVAPGDSTWNSFAGRHSNMLANVRSAAEHGLKNGATGLLMTHWGDNGHMQPWVFSLPGLVAGGLSAWNAKAFDPIDLPAFLRTLFFDDPSETLALVVLKLADLDERIPVKILNQSFLSACLRLPDEKLRAHLGGIEESLLESFGERIGSLRADLAAARPDCPDAESILSEVHLTLDLSDHALAICRSVKEGKLRPTPRPELVTDYTQRWLARSRRGGLDSSLRLNLTHSRV